MRILCLGSNGMAGHVIARHLEESGFDVTTVSGKKEIDLTKKGSIDKLFNKKKFDIIVNCVGVLIGQAYDNETDTTILNCYLPHELSEKARVIHLSTDCVFSGEDGPYKEDSEWSSKDYYGKTKAMGELDNDKDLTFRMSIIGPELRDGLGLFNWFMKQSECDGYTNVVWNGITTVELAKGIKAAIEQDLTGLYHLVPKENITKYDLLRLIAEKFGKSVIIHPKNGGLNDKTLINTRSDFDYQVPDYRRMIEDMKDWMMNHKDLYGRYL